MKRIPGVSSEADPEKRAATLVTVAARLMLTAIYERTDAVIYASQVELLSYLNAQVDGDSADRLRELFYAPATIRFPDVYKTYPFESYLGFLQSSFLVRIDGLRAVITVEGREFLVWRVQQKKPPRLIG